MCYALPGPRCSSHAKESLNRAYTNMQQTASIAMKMDDKESPEYKAAIDKYSEAKQKFEEAQYEYSLTPEYFQQRERDLNRLPEKDPERAEIIKELEEKRAERNNRIRKFCWTHPGEGPEQARRDVLKEASNYIDANKARVDAMKAAIDAGEPVTPEMMQNYHKSYDNFRYSSNVKREVRLSLMDEDAAAKSRAWSARKQKEWEDGRKNWVPPAMETQLTSVEQKNLEKALSEDGAIFVDLETTTTNPMTGHIIEAAFVKSDGTRLHKFFGVPPLHEKWNGTGAEDIHHISPEEVKDKPVFINDESAHKEMQDFIGDRVIVAHNAKFEKDWLTKNGIQADFLDTKHLYAKIVEEKGDVPTTANTRMEDFCNEAGVQYEDAHRAINDTLMMQQAWGTMSNKFAERLKEEPAPEI